MYSCIGYIFIRIIDDAVALKIFYRKSGEIEIKGTVLKFSEFVTKKRVDPAAVNNPAVFRQKIQIPRFW